MNVPLRNRLRGWFVPLSLLSAGTAFAASRAVHADPIAPVILGVTGMLFFAILGRHVARQLNQPSVLGELMIGMLIGVLGSWLGVELVIVLREGPAVFEMVDRMLGGESLPRAARDLLGIEAAERLLAVLQGTNGGTYMQVAHTVDVFSRYGVIFLLFLVGLKSSVEEMRSVGFEAARVAVLGVLAPFALGFVCMRLLLPGVSLNTDMFVAATLGATSVGISAAVLRELGRDSSAEGHIVLGAAVIDDILGLLTLAVVSGIVVSGGLEFFNAISIVVLACLFLFGAVRFGPHILRLTIRLLSRFDIIEAKMFTSFMFVMVLAWLASLVGLAAIVGAFTAGVILHEGYFRDLHPEGRHMSIRELIMPLEAVLVPIFFVLMGMQVKVESFLEPRALLVALGLVAAAMIGKLASGWAARRDRNRWIIGFGMMPRGEVGLIFASIGRSLGVISDELFSAVVLMVILTTLAAPPLIKLATRLDRS